MCYVLQWYIGRLFPKDSPKKFKILTQIRFLRGWHLEFSSNGFKFSTQHSNAFEVNIPLLASKKDIYNG